MMKTESISQFFKKNVSYFIVGLVCGIYILTGVFGLVGNTKSFSQILGDGALLFILGYFLNRIFETQGLLNGENNERTQATYKLHGQSVEKITSHIEKLEEWCEEKNEEALKSVRTRILLGQGMRYSDYFEEDGKAKGYNHPKENDKRLKQIYKERKKAYLKAVKIKISYLSTNSLTSEGGNEFDPYNLGRTKKQYKTNSALIDFISKFVVSFIFGYYGVVLLQNFSWAMLIWTSLQVGILLANGIFKMNMSYMFILDEYRNRIIKKINHLESFYNFIQNQKESENVELKKENN